MVSLDAEASDKACSQPTTPSCRSSWQTRWTATAPAASGSWMGRSVMGPSDRCEGRPAVSSQRESRAIASSSSDSRPAPYPKGRRRGANNHGRLAQLWPPFFTDLSEIASENRTEKTISKMESRTLARFPAAGSACIFRFKPGLQRRKVPEHRPRIHLARAGDRLERVGPRPRCPHGQHGRELLPPLRRPCMCAAVRHARPPRRRCMELELSTLARK